MHFSFLISKLCLGQSKPIFLFFLSINKHLWPARCYPLIQSRLLSLTASLIFLDPWRPNLCPKLDHPMDCKILVSQKTRELTPAELEDDAPKSLIEEVFFIYIYLFIWLFAFYLLPFTFYLLPFTFPFYLLPFTSYLVSFAFYF